MSIQRKMRKSKVPVSLADCKMGIDGCRLFVGHVNPKHASQVAKEFKNQLGGLIERSKRSEAYALVYKSLEFFN